MGVIMDDLRFNKIAGAVLATALAFIGVGTIADALYSGGGHGGGEELAYGNDIMTSYLESLEAGPGEVVELPFPQAEWVAAMDMAKGESVTKKCTSCHTFEKGGANGTGPNLYGIVGRPAASVAGFNYSAPMAESSITWDYESLDAYLERPALYVKGTAMTFVGLKKEEDRAAVIEYMRMQSDAPMDRPEPVVMIEEELAVEGEGETTETVEDMTAEDIPSDTEGNVVEEIVEEMVDGQE